MRKDCSAGRGLLALGQTNAFSPPLARLSTKKPGVSGILVLFPDVVRLARTYRSLGEFGEAVVARIQRHSYAR
jgi:hypothetical protein